MGTRSYIIKQKPESSLWRAIHCHWDGYPSNNGRLLATYYTDPNKVERLIDLGDISSLGADIGEAHNFDEPMRTPEMESWTTAYHRDRRESWEDTAPVEAESVEVLVRLGVRAGAEWVYLFADGLWYVLPVEAFAYFDSEYKLHFYDNPMPEWVNLSGALERFGRAPDTESGRIAWNRRVNNPSAYLTFPKENAHEAD